MTGKPTTKPDEISRSDAGAGLESPKAAVESAARAWGKYALGMLLVVVLVLVLGQDNYWLGLLGMGLLFGGLAAAWNIIGGFGGQFSLGHAVFFGVGAYSVALLQVRAGWPVLAGLAVGVVLAVPVAVLLALPLFRLRGAFFAIGTLAVHEVFVALVNFFEWTGGPRGVRIPVAEMVSFSRRTWTFIFFLYMAAVVAHSLLIIRSRLGYYLIAVRDDQEAAAAAGASPLWVKTQGLIISACWTALGGGLFVSFIGFLDPPSLLNIVDIGVRFPLLALIGGLSTVAGPVIGALFLQPAEAYITGGLANLPVGVSRLIIGLILVLGALFFKKGIWGFVTDWKERLRGSK